MDVHAHSTDGFHVIIPSNVPHSTVKHPSSHTEQRGFWPTVVPIHHAAIAETGELQHSLPERFPNGTERQDNVQLVADFGSVVF